MDKSFAFSYLVLTHKEDQVMPLPCREWDHLKSKISCIKFDHQIFNSVSFLFWGAALSTFISVLSGSYSSSSSPQAIYIAWATIIFCSIVGVVSFYFSKEQTKAFESKAKDIVEQMTLIEQRYERPKV